MFPSLQKSLKWEATEYTWSPSFPELEGTCRVGPVWWLQVWSSCVYVSDRVRGTASNVVWPCEAFLIFCCYWDQQWCLSVYLKLLLVLRYVNSVNKYKHKLTPTHLFDSPFSGTTYVSQYQKVQEGLAVASIARDVVVEMCGKFGSEFET